MSVNSFQFVRGHWSLEWNKIWPCRSSLFGVIPVAIVAIVASETIGKDTMAAEVWC